jgi:predicted nucleic acid-binding Zn ribbon protein
MKANYTYIDHRDGLRGRWALALILIALTMLFSCATIPDGGFESIPHETCPVCGQDIYTGGAK